MESICLPNINITRTKSIEMSKIVSNSEIHLHHCLCEFRGFKIGRSNHRMCSVKKVFFKILQIWEKNTFLQSTSGRLLEEARWPKILILCS